jgi:alkylhydroperoxidase/carboxymuconolactone decarboxylase family protein YurZ
MRKTTGMLPTMAIALAIGVVGGFAQTAKADDSSAQSTYRDIERTLGSVPGFFKQFPESGIAGAWAEFKSVQLNPKTKLDGKTKELIGLAVAAQIPCHYCI